LRILIEDFGFAGARRRSAHLVGAGVTARAIGLDPTARRGRIVVGV
jgi:hypothetical protein